MLSVVRPGMAGRSLVLLQNEGFWQSAPVVWHIASTHDWLGVGIRVLKHGEGRQDTGSVLDLCYKVGRDVECRQLGEVQSVPRAQGLLSQQ